MSDLLKSYTERAAYAIAGDLDWHALGLLHQPPKEYHFTRKGYPDKRYSNYLEVLAYWEAEEDLRQTMMSAPKQPSNKT